MISDQEPLRVATERRHLRDATVPQEQPILWAPIAGTIATVTVFAVAQGLTYPLLSFILERQGTPPD